MGKDNIVFHSVIWPAILLGYNGEGDHGGKPGALGELGCRPRSSPASSSRWRAGSSPRPARSSSTSATSWSATTPTRCATSSRSPARRRSDTDFTWAEFLRRNNDELVAGWGNLVNRSISMAAKNFGAIPAAGRADRRGRARCWRPSAAGFATRRRAARAVTGRRRPSTRRCGSSARRTSTSPTRRRGSSRTRTRTRMGTVLHVALQAVERLQHAAHAVPAALRAEDPRAARRHRAWHAPMPEIARGRRPRRRPGYPVLTGDYDAAARAGSRVPIEAGTPLAAPTPVFRKLDPSVVDEELARLEADGRLVTDERPPAPRAAAGPPVARAPLPSARRAVPTATATSTSSAATVRRGALAAAAAVGVAARRPGRLRPAARSWAVEAAPRARRSWWPPSRCTPTRRRGWPAPATLDEALRRDRAAGRPTAGRRAVGETGLDHFRTGAGRARRAGGVVPRAHRDGQAARQGAGHPRPRRARRRAARAGRGGRAGPGRLPLLLRRRGDGASTAPTRGYCLSLRRHR